MTTEINVDSLLPPEMARKAEAVGVAKAQGRAHYLFLLAVLAGAFIAMGAVFATVVFSGGITVSTAAGVKAYSAGLPYGVTRLLGGVVFSLGLILVIIGGAELFTGNVLIVMAWASRKVTTGGLLRNWGIVYLGNFVGALLSAVLVFLSGQHLGGSGTVGLTALNIARAKVELDFLPAVASGILCNALVCMAVWLTFSARTTVDKILAIVFPISAFVAAGFEHCIANMFFVPVGLMIKDFAGPEFWSLIGKGAGDYASLTWGAFLVKNLLPVTLGNVIGGGLLVAAIYWLIYLWKPAQR
ncbi:MAG: formate transporter FocA [Anaerolineaceae bacterium]|nr:formate transporter FocA [Anaerolineaceae bacterium]